jgi:hypothetical protein
MSLTRDSDRPVDGHTRVISVPASHDEPDPRVLPEGGGGGGGQRDVVHPNAGGGVLVTSVALTLAELAHRGVTLAPSTVEDTIEKNISTVAQRLGIQVRSA